MKIIVRSEVLEWSRGNVILVQMEGSALNRNMVPQCKGRKGGVYGGRFDSEKMK